MKPGQSYRQAPGSDAWETGSLHRRIAVSVTAGACVLLLRAWCATWRKDFSEVQRFDEMRAQGGPVIAVFWHGSYIPLFIALAGRSGLVITSHSFRGAVLAAIARRSGARSMQLGRGSHGASKALRAELSRSDGLVAIAVDGPLGPAHVVKPGLAALAARTTARIVPVCVISEHALELSRRWDHMQLPLPTSRVRLRIGEALDLSAVDVADMQAATGKIQAALLDLEAG